MKATKVLLNAKLNTSSSEHVRVRDRLSPFPGQSFEDFRLKGFARHDF